MSQIYVPSVSGIGNVNSVHGTFPVVVNPTTGNVVVGISPNVPFVNAFLNTPLSNVTGDGTAYTIIFDSVTADGDPPDYNATNGVFTAPIDGNYQITATATFLNVTSSFTLANLMINSNMGGSTNFSTTQNPGKVFNRDGAYSQTVTCNLGLIAGNSFSIQALVSGGTKSVGLQGAAGGNWTYLNISWINP